MLSVCDSYHCLYLNGPDYWPQGNNKNKMTITSDSGRQVKSKILHYHREVTFLIPEYHVLFKEAVFIFSLKEAMAFLENSKIRTFPDFKSFYITTAIINNTVWSLITAPCYTLNFCGL